MENQYFTVSQINKYINSKMKSDDNLRRIYVKGEISNYRTYPSGHSYFTLKDSSSQINGVMFKGNKRNLKFEPKDGMKVIIYGKIEVYERNGQYQLYASSITEDGIGELYIAYEQLKKKLKEEGLFDKSHKKEIPKYPETIGVVTAQTGAAIRDIITTINRRYPQTEILVFSSLVQGDQAADQIVRQIRNAQNVDCKIDTLIVGRGGGSIEDLWPFNEEKVARAIYECKIPVISAVGHEIDYTISDYVSDLRAPTPTAAAELAVPDINEIKYKIQNYSNRANKSISDKLVKNKEKLREISKKQVFKNPESVYDIKKMHLDNLFNKFDSASKNIIINNKNKLFKLENSLTLKKPELITKNKRERFLRNVGKLEVLNPILTLKRGYSIVKTDDGVVSSAKELDTGDEVDIEFNDGTVHTKVI